MVHVLPSTEEQFQQALLELPPLDFILSDFRLDEQDGVYYIQKLREEFNTEIPACILTADTSPTHLKLFRDLNIEVLYKPIEVASITQFIAARLQ